MLDVNGTAYKFAPFGLALGLKATPEYRRLRKELFNEIIETAKELPAEACKELVLEAFRELSSSHAATQQQVFEWLATPEGNQWQVKWALQSVNAQMTDADCEAVYASLTPAQWREFDAFQTEPFRASASEQQRLRADLMRVMKSLNGEITDEQCEAVFEYLVK